MDNRELENRALYYKAIMDYRQKSDSKHEEGFMFLKEAADRGYAEAEKLMGVLYMSGQYAPYPEKNMDIAILCYEAAAEDGDVEAMYWLSQCYEMGMGVEKNPDMADKWRIRAIANGFVPAAENEDEEAEEQQDEFRPKKVAPPKELTEEEADRELAVEEEARKLADRPVELKEATKVTTEASEEASEEKTSAGETSAEETSTEETSAEEKTPDGITEPSEEKTEENKVNKEAKTAQDNETKQKREAAEKRERDRIAAFREKTAEKENRNSWMLPLKYGAVFGVIALLGWLVLMMILYLAAGSMIGEEAKAAVIGVTVVISLAALVIGAILGVKEGTKQAAEAAEYEAGPFYESYRWEYPLEQEQEWLYKTFKTLSRTYEPVRIGTSCEIRKRSEDKRGWLLPGWFFQTDRGSTRPEFAVLTDRALYVVRAMQVKGRLAGSLKDLEWTLRIDPEVKRGMAALKSGGPLALLTGKETAGAVEKLLNMVDENAFGAELIKEELSQRSGLSLGSLPVYNVLMFGPSLDIREVKLSGAPEYVMALQGDAGKLLLQMERTEFRLPLWNTDTEKLLQAVEQIGLKQLGRGERWEQNQKREMEELCSQTFH